MEPIQIVRYFFTRKNFMEFVHHKKISVTIWTKHGKGKANCSEISVTSHCFDSSVWNNAPPLSTEHK